MKRAFPQETNPVPFSAISNDAAMEQPKQTLSESNRRVRTSAAMIGLAISMGAYSVLAPQQGDTAAAAEPIAAEPTTASAATTSDIAVLPPISEVASIQSSIVEHTVQEGQTLWKIAQLHGVGISKLAAANNLRSDSVLYVGQVLQVPTSHSISTAEQPTISVTNESVTNESVTREASKEVDPLSSSEPVSIIASSQPAVYAQPDEAQQLLKNKQDVSVQSLKQQRDRLKQSLAELKSEESDRTVQASVQAVLPEAEQPDLVGYQVSSGDTLSSIAQTHGISYSELAKINHLADPNLVRVNQLIKVPQPKRDESQSVELSSQAASESTPSVTVPVVPSLASIKSSSSSTTSVPSIQVLPPTTGVGGDAEQVALATPGVTSGGQVNRTQSPQLTNVGRSDLYVSNLVSEVVKLREKYQSRSFGQPKPLFAGRAQAADSSTLSSSTRRVNPEFRPNRNLETLQAELRSLQQRERKSESKPQARVGALLSSVPKAKPQVVAVAPAGSESYAPLVRSSVGKMVSPSLPPLGKPDSYLPGSGKFAGYIWPAKGMLTSPYGWRWGRMHKGIDIAAPIGTPVVAAAPGKVITAGWNDGGYGNLVEIKHADGSVTLYAHNSRILVKVGQQVTQAQQIAEMGSTGFSTGPHSHFEVHLPGQGAVNPVAYLPQNRG